MESLGILAALGAALAWGTYAVPFKISKSENLVQFQALTGVGIFLSGLIISKVAGYSLNLNSYGLLSGVLWGIANAIFLTALSNLGISRAVPVVSSLVIISSFLWGVLVFNELPTSAVTGFLGIGAIILGVILVSTTENTQSQNIKKGLLAAVLSGLIFGSQLVPLKFGHVATTDFFFSTTIGIFLTGLIIFLVKKVGFKNEAVAMSILSGIIWNVGNLLSLISISLIGLAKAIPTTQSSSLIAVLWGIFYFKEITQPRHRLQVLVGATILLIGVIMLGMA